MWKLELQKLADETGITISVCHFPPGTSKWNKIEHRLFSFISSNWKGQPLQAHETVVQLISSHYNSKRTQSSLSIGSQKISNRTQSLKGRNEKHTP